MVWIASFSALKFTSVKKIYIYEVCNAIFYLKNKNKIIQSRFFENASKAQNSYIFLVVEFHVAHAGKAEIKLSMDAERAKYLDRKNKYKKKKNLQYKMRLAAKSCVKHHSTSLILLAWCIKKNFFFFTIFKIKLFFSYFI